MWAWLWLVWILFFLVVEGIALFNSSKQDTLSEQVWAYVTQPDRRRGKKSAAWWVWPGRIGIALFAGWLVFHFWTGV